MSAYITTDFGRFEEAAQKANDGDTIAVHPKDGGPPALYEVVDHPGARELRHVTGSPLVIPDRIPVVVHPPRERN